MGATFSHVLKVLQGAREGVTPKAGTFRPVDVDEMASQLDLDARAREDGLASHPGEDALVEPVVETDIRAEIELRAARARHEYEVRIDLYESRIKSGLAVLNLEPAIEGEGQRAILDFRAQARDDRNHLFPIREQARSRQREFDEFRLRHGLNRLPHSPSSKILLTLLIMCVFLGESILNGFFFARGSETGLVGGVMLALVLSGLNILVAVTYGRFGFGYVGHRHFLPRLVGAGLMIAYAGLAIALNLGIGHFRDLHATGEGQVALAAVIDRFREMPFAFTDAQSLLLVILGIVFSIGAAVSAHGLDDGYPGFGVIARRRDEALSLLAGHLSQCLQDLTTRRDDAIREMTSVVEEVRRGNHELQLAIQGRARLHQEYLKFLDHLKESYSRLIQRYRATNLRSRSGRPVWFSADMGWAGHGPSLTRIEESEKAAQTASRIIERIQFFIRQISEECEIQLIEYGFDRYSSNKESPSHR